MKLFFLFSCGLLSAQFCHAEVFNILKYGAKPDGQTINTSSIQKAIDDCNRAGGGTVLVPSGIFLSGTIFLKSNVEFHLEKGAVLKGSPNLQDYIQSGIVYGLIYATDAENISITGGGEVNGNAIAFMEAGQLHTFIDYDPKLLRQGDRFMHNFTGISDGPIKPKPRPDMMITIKHSSNVRMDGLYLTEAPNWTIRIGECEDVIITSLMILNNRLIPNNDGIHCTTSRNVVISNCDISCGDDGIIVTGFGDETGTGGYTEKPGNQSYRFGNKTHEAQHVVVSNCVIASSSAGIRVGYGMNNIRDVSFDNILIHDSNRGILVQCRDSNTIEQLKFSHITISTKLLTGCWWGKGEPISVSTMPQTGTVKVGKVKRVIFSDITVTHAEAGIVFYGMDANSSIDDVTLENINVHLSTGPQTENFGGNFDLQPTNNFSTNLFKHDVPAIFGRYVNDVKMRNVKISWDEKVPEFYTGALEFESFNNISIDGFTGRQAKNKGAAIQLTDGNGIEVFRSAAAKGTDLFLNATRCTDLRFFVNNDLSNSFQKINYSDNNKFKIEQGNIY